MRETHSEIRAEIATYQAQIDTAHEKAVNRANAYARQLMIEAESEAKANAALLHAQALDFKAVNSASYPEILEYRYRQQAMDRIETIADKLPQVVNIGPAEGHTVDFMALARQMLGVTEGSLYSADELEMIRKQMGPIARRLKERSEKINKLTAGNGSAVNDDKVEMIVEVETAGTYRNGRGGSVMTTLAKPGFSRIKEVVAAWQNVRQYLRSGEGGHLVPVVIPKDKRSFAWIYIMAMGLFVAGFLIILSSRFIPLGILSLLFFIGIAVITLWRGAIVEIEEGTTGILSHYGKIQGMLRPGRHFLWWPWQKVDFIVDTSTEIPYTAPVLSSPTHESVPLKSIEFFLKFRIVNPILFVRHIGASNYDVVLSSAVQDAIRRRSRQVETARAYDLRGSDVGDMQAYLNKQMQRLRRADYRGEHPRCAAT